MKILNELPIKEKTAVAIGLFDGVHKGHKALINDLEAQAGLKSLVYTFDRKPNHFAYKNIYTLDEKEQIFSSMGVDYFCLQKFDETFSNLTKEEFLKKVIYDFCAKHITVGFDFKFGKNAEGNIDFLQENCAKYDYTLSVIPEISYEGIKISSSYIRSLLSEGNMQQAAKLLGRFYFINGTIVKGNHIGTKIGFPTANLSADKLMPKYGVYATIAQIGNKRYRAVTNVGTKPTIKNDNIPNVETYILDFDEDIYDENLRVYFVQRVRREQAFATVDQLKAQIAIDAIKAAELLKNLDVYNDYIM
ncbi:MAG: bifunctional riboflavin kinase/FAD synthetase, partial [Christensenellaceae bacterium]